MHILQGLLSAGWRMVILNRGCITTKKPSRKLEGFCYKVGGDLLSHILLCSTIGAGGLNFSVRNGKRWNPSAIATLRL
jgi:hypothetical protein